MMTASRGIALGALGAALLIHAALAVFLLESEEAQIEGGAGAPETRLGTSFADMVAGTQTALQAVERAERAPTAVTPPPAARPEAATAEPFPAEPVPAEPVRPVAPEPTSEAQPEANTAEAVRPAEVLKSPAESIAELSAEVTRSLRPKRRTPEFEATHQRARAVPDPEPAPDPVPEAKPAPRGNAAQDAAAGAATGTAEAVAPSSGADAPASSAAGNAAASSYPGLVMERIARVPRPRMAARGTAVVTFAVAANGGLASAAIAASSGSGDLDGAALRIIQSAAPFPPPPPGAQRSFTISIEGR